MLYRWVFRLPWNVIQEVAADQNLPANLLAALVQVESNGDQYACRFEKDYKYLFETKQNAKDNNITETTEMMLQMTSWGLTQVMGAVGRELGLKGPLLQLTDPEINLTYCAKLLKRLASKHTERNDIIASYNAGSPVRTLDGKYRNQGYVDKVNAALAVFDEIQKGGK